DFPTTITIYASPPTLGGAQTHDLGAGAYIQAIVKGSVKIADAITFYGTLSVTAEFGTTSFVRITGAVTTTIKYVGGLSGSIDFSFFANHPQYGVGIVGRASLALDVAPAQAFSFSGHFMFEVNL